MVIFSESRRVFDGPVGAEMRLESGEGTVVSLVEADGTPCSSVDHGVPWLCFYPDVPMVFDGLGPCLPVLLFPGEMTGGGEARFALDADTIRRLPLDVPQGFCRLLVQTVEAAAQGMRVPPHPSWFGARACPRKYLSLDAAIQERKKV